MVGTLASVVGLFLGLGLAKVLFWLFDLVGFTLPNSGLLFETRTIVVSLAGRDHRDAAREPPSRHPRDARATDRRRPRGGDAAAVALRPFPHGRLARDDRPRLRRPALRALRQRSRDDADPPLDGRRRAADLRRRLALRRPARPAARGSARRTGRTARRLGGTARARQLTAQSAADRLDRVGADDRPGARHARGDARGRDHEHVPRRRRQDLHLRLRDHGAEQLLADPDRRRRGSREDARRRGDREHPLRRGARLRLDRVRHRRRPGRGRGDHARLGRRARRTSSASSAPTARSSTTASRRITASASARRSPSSSPRASSST